MGLDVDEVGRIKEKPVPADADGAREQRARVRVLARSPRVPIREQAIARLEELGKRQALGAEDRLLLAQLHESRGAPERAREIVRDLLAAEGNNPAYLAYHARLLLQLRQTDEADRCTEKLEALEKSRRLPANTLGAVELRAQVRERQGKSDEAIALILPLTRQADVTPEHLSLAIGCYSRQKRFNDALDLCGRAWETCPPEMAARMSAAVLHRCHEPNRRPRRARLQAAIRKPTRLRTTCCSASRISRTCKGNTRRGGGLPLADTRSGSCDGVEQPVVVADGARGKGTKPWLINRAISGAERGRVPGHRACVQLALQNASGAREDLEKAARATPSAVHYLHLARTHTLANDLPAASAALNRARAAGLDPDKLHPLEKASYQKLLEALPQR